jgi:hypothetical protein
MPYKKFSENLDRILKRKEEKKILEELQLPIKGGEPINENIKYEIKREIKIRITIK